MKAISLIIFLSKYGFTNNIRVYSFFFFSHSLFPEFSLFQKKRYFYQIFRESKLYAIIVGLLWIRERERLIRWFHCFGLVRHSRVTVALQATTACQPNSSTMNLFIRAVGRRGPYSTEGIAELGARWRKMYDSALKYREYLQLASER